MPRFNMDHDLDNDTYTDHDTYHDTDHETDQGEAKVFKNVLKKKTIRFR